MKLQSKKWEYASEMILKSVHMKLKTIEVPIKFYKDIEGRESHMIRSGWLEPWRAGFQNLCSMLVYGADFFFLKPGLIIFLLTFSLITLIRNGEVTLFELHLSTFSMLSLLFISISSLVVFYVGILSKVIYDFNRKYEKLIKNKITLNRVFVFFIITCIISLFYFLPLSSKFIENNFNLLNLDNQTKFNAIYGLYIGTLGIITVGVHLLLNAIINTSNFRK